MWMENGVLTRYEGLIDLFISRNDEVGVLDCGVGFGYINWRLSSFDVVDMIVFSNVRFFLLCMG